VSKRGLPVDFKLRHDAHYVEVLTGRGLGAPIGRMIAIDKLEPNPEQPRIDLGDLEELIASIREKGVLEPLLVRPSEVGGRFMIISGERRYRASLEAGLKEVPCIEMDVDERAVAEIALIENLQRKDLNAFEEADGLKILVDRFGYTHEEVARRIGKSRTSITESLSISSIPHEIREQCRHADIVSKSMLLQVVRQPSDDEMRVFVDNVRSRGLNREQARKLRGGRDKAEGFSFRHAPQNLAWSLVIKFRKARVSKAELRDALETALSSLDD
jgi:ParB family chromosome partitioning protein